MSDVKMRESAKSEMKVLVTGATGFVGQWVCAALDKIKIPYIGVGFQKYGACPSPENSKNKIFDVDLRNFEAATQLIQTQKPTHILHLAWYVAHGQYWQSPQNLEAMAMTLHLFQQFYQSGGRRFVSVGTCAEYDWTQSGPFAEFSPLVPQSVYGQVKKSTFEILNDLSNRWGISFSWARPFYPFGPGEPDAKIVPSLFRAILNHQEMRLSGGPHVKDFIYIKDVAKILSELLISDLKGPINVSSGEGVSIRDLSAMAESICSRSGVFEWNNEPKPNEPRYLVGSDARRKLELNCNLDFDLRSGMEDYFRNCIHSSVDSCAK